MVDKEKIGHRERLRESFLRGEEAWNKLDSETAFFEFRTALENDPGFSLAHIRMAEVLAFRSDRDGARSHLEQALAQKERMIEVEPADGSHVRPCRAHRHGVHVWEIAHKWRSGKTYRRSTNCG